MYDSFDRRVEKHLLGDLVVYYWYGPDGSVLAETDAEGNTTTENIYLDGGPLAVLGPDRDGDWVLDRYDNCVAHKNLDQRDTDGDGFGNRCDPDLDNNGIVGPHDRDMMSDVFFCMDSSPACQNADLDGSGAVNFTDLGILASMYGQPPGPKGGDNPNGVSGTLYVHTDHLGTPRMITDDSGTAVWQAWYEPFGKATVTDNQIDPVVFNLRFPGQYYDSETGLHYNYRRFYDPSTGRYLTSDPIGLLGGLNT